MYMGGFLLWVPAARPDNSDYRQSGGIGNAVVIVLLNSWETGTRDIFCMKLCTGDGINCGKQQCPAEVCDSGVFIRLYLKCSDKV